MGQREQCSLGVRREIEERKMCLRLQLRHKPSAQDGGDERLLA